MFMYICIFLSLFFSHVTTVVKLLTPYPIAFVVESEPPPYLKISGLIFFWFIL